MSIPLKAEYEWVNSTFEGTKSAIDRHSDQSDHPADPPPDFNPDGGGGDDSGQGGDGPGIPPSGGTTASMGDPLAPEVVDMPPIIPIKAPSQVPASTE